MRQVRLILPVKCVFLSRLASLAFIVFSALLPASAEDFTIDSYVMGGGGGDTSDSDYEVTCTIGQPAAGVIGDSSLTIQSGFWNETLIDGAIFVEWAGGGSFQWQVDDVTGAAGGDPGWTTTNIIGTLGITADTASRFKLILKTLNGASPEMADNWFNTSDYTWELASASYGIIGFSPDKFQFTTDAFANDTGRGGNFTIEQSGNTLQLKFNPLLAVADSGERPSGSGTKINVLANDLLNSGTPSISAFDSYSTNGGTLRQVGAFLFYTPSGNPVNDLFHYTLSDGNGHTSTGTVTIAIRGVNDAVSRNIVGSSGNSGNFTITFAGIPGVQYRAQWTESLGAGHSWTDFATNIIGATGLSSATDHATHPQVFYRTVSP